MATLTQLDRFYPSLSAKERARMVLEAWKEHRDEDRLVRATMPDHQVREFNRSIGIMNGVNEKLAVYLVWLQAMVDQVGIKLGWLLSLALNEMDLENEMRDDRQDDAKRKRRRKRRFKSLEQLGRVLVENIRARVVEHWQELRAVEIVVQEAGRELDMDLFIPEAQAFADNIRKELLDVHDWIKHFGEPFELTDPDEERIDRIRAVIERSIQKALE